MLSVRVKRIQTYTVHISNAAKDNDERIHHPWIVPVMFNSLRFTNDPRYLEGDRISWTVSASKG